MEDFTFYAPTKIYFGHHKDEEIGLILSNYHVHKVLLHYGQGSVVKSGLLARIKQNLREHDIGFFELGGVLPNPDIAFVREGIALIRQEPVDLILAIGGGSVIDSAKSIANGYYYDGDAWDFNIGAAKPERALPVGVILTIAAAGSEMSSSCVISNRATGIKRGFNSDTNRPLFAVLNPELTFSVSPYQTACGVVDILMHTLERYFNASTYNELADNMAEGLLRTVIDAGWRAFRTPDDYEARATLMMASSLSHNGLTSIGKKANMPVHQLEHVLSGRYDQVAHGAGLAVLFPAWARFYAEKDTFKFAKFARNVMHVELENDLESARLGIDRLANYFMRLEMPKTFEELGLNDVDINELVEVLLNNRQVIDHHICPMDSAVARIIYQACRGDNYGKK